MSTTKRRFAMLLATTAIIAAACSGGGTSPAPSTQRSVNGQSRRLPARIDTRSPARKPGRGSGKPPRGRKPSGRARKK